MKNLFKIFLVIFVFIISQACVFAYEFDLMVLPINLFSEAENYYCFTDTSSIIAHDVEKNLKSYKNVNTVDIYTIRTKLNSNEQLKAKTFTALDNFAKNDKIDFDTFTQLADYFGVKSILLINSYASNDKMTERKNLWDILEISSAFKIRYPIELNISATLLDCVNRLVMWNGKYSKEVSDSEGYFLASNQMLAYSQLEKIMIYSKNNVSQNISQGVYTRFFPREVRTFFVKSEESNSQEQTPRFVPNALEHLSNPHMQSEFEKFNFETQNNADDFIFEF